MAKKTINREAFFSEMSDLIALYEQRKQNEPSMKEYYDACIAAVRAVMSRVDGI